MTTHDLARQLLAGPNQEVRVAADKWDATLIQGDITKKKWANAYIPPTEVRVTSNITYIIASEPTNPLL